MGTLKTIGIMVAAIPVVLFLLLDCGIRKLRGKDCPNIFN